jgi:hypothetical protein
VRSGTPALIIVDAAITASWYLIPIPGESTLRGVLFHLAGYIFAEAFALSFAEQIGVIFLVTYVELLAMAFAIRWVSKRRSAS